MSTNDPSQPPAGGPPPEEPSGPSFDGWDRVFSDPSQYNPHEIEQHHRWVEDLTGDNHEQTLTQAMREWGYLQPGESVSDLQAAIQAVREQRADPFARPAPEPTGYQQGYEPPGTFDEQNEGVDPYTLREVWRQDMAEIAAEQRRELEAAQAQAQVGYEINRQIDEIAHKHQFDARDREELVNRVNYRIAQGDLHPAQISTLVKDVYDQHQAYVDALIARRLAAGEANKAAEGTHPPGAGAGVPPAPETQVTNFKSLAARTMERVREMDGE